MTQNKKSIIFLKLNWYLANNIFSVVRHVLQNQNWLLYYSMHTISPLKMRYSRLQYTPPYYVIKWWLKLFLEIWKFHNYKMVNCVVTYEHVYSTWIHSTMTKFCFFIHCYKKNHVQTCPTIKRTYTLPWYKNWFSS